jgi:hypothetical protein
MTVAVASACFIAYTSYIWFSGRFWGYGEAPEIAMAQQIQQLTPARTIVISDLGQGYDPSKFTFLLLDHLSADQPDVIVLELGDGLMGAYGVDELLADPRFQQRTTSVVLAGNDVIGAWAAANELERQGYQVAAITGPATDNLAGVARLEGLGRPSANVHREPEKLWSLIESSLGVEA